jgi:CDP-diacylglycerol--glycerol-3-phosphate 3-phosphatidyltransferase
MRGIDFMKYFVYTLFVGRWANGDESILTKGDEIMERVLTVPNGITVLRLFVGVGGIMVAMQPGYFLWGITVFILCGLVPDVLDGWIARKYDQRSRLGEFLDPLADKILFYYAVIVLFSHIVWWPALIVLGICDVISTALHFIKNGGAVRSGKNKFIAQCFALGLYVCSALISEHFIAFANIVLVIATIFALHSLWRRVRQ